MNFLKFAPSVLLLSFSFAVPAWVTNLEQAKEDAEVSGKFIIINFSYPYQPGMNTVKNIYSSRSFLTYASSNLVLLNTNSLHVNGNYAAAEIKQDESLIKKYNPERIFPLIVLADAHGNEMQKWNKEQLSSPDDFIEQVKGAISRTKQSPPIALSLH